MAYINNPLISIITVCLNSDKTLGRTMSSVLNQSYKNLEYIIIDGASKDNTLSIIKGYEKQFILQSIPFRWISEPDNGIYYAMNKGINMATGEIIGILNSDDYYEEDAVRSIIDANENQPRGEIFYGFMRTINNERELVIYRYNFENYLLDLKTGIYSSVQHPACFVKKQVYDRIGAFDVLFSLAADYDFLIRAMKEGVKFSPVDGIIANFTLGGSYANASQSQQLDERYRVLFKNGLLSEAEYRKKRRYMKYKSYKCFKEFIIRTLFGL